MKRILNISLWSTLIIGLVFVLGFINIEQKKIICKDIVINIEYGQTDPLITNDDIYSKIIDIAGNIKGKPVSSIDPEYIENYISNNSYIASSNVYITIEGILKIDIKQRQPLLRVINRLGQSYYIGESGVVIPINKNYPVRVMIANGSITEFVSLRKSNSICIVPKNDTTNIYPVNYKLFKLAGFINTNKFFHALIEQIYVNQNQEFELIPKIGGQVIIFGDIYDMEAKFDKLFAFYKNGIGTIDWAKYKSINLKYENQVVCTKH